MALFIVGGLLALFLFGNVIGSIFSVVTTPLYGVRSWFVESSGTVPLYFRERGELIGELKDLKNQIAGFIGRDLTLSKLVDENEKLRALLNVNAPDRIAAGVIARPPYVPYDALLVDRGRDDGLVEGGIVYHEEDRAIGFVAKTYEDMSLVTLFSSPGVKSTVYIIGPDIYTTAHGEGGGVMRVSVPQGIEISEGNIVVLPSLLSGIVGAIHTIESVAIKPEQNGYVVFETPIQSLQFVSVETKPLGEVTFEEAKEHVENMKKDLRIEVPAEVIVTTEFSTSTDEALTPDEE